MIKVEGGLTNCAAQSLDDSGQCTGGREAAVKGMLGTQGYFEALVAPETGCLRKMISRVDQGKEFCNESSTLV